MRGNQREHSLSYDIQYLNGSPLQYTPVQLPECCKSLIMAGIKSFLDDICNRVTNVFDNS